jgi:hypothetical protein
MSDLIRITKVEPRDQRWLRLWFSDGAVKDVDVGEVVSRGTVFREINRNDAAFARVRVNDESGTVEWPGGIDLDPLVLYGCFEPDSGVRIERHVIRPPLAA